MRVLILSSNNGGGHNAVAAAIRETFEARGDVCRVEDCLSFISEDVSEAVARSHSFVYRHAPKLFDSGYRHTRKHPSTFMENHNGRRMLNLGRKHLGRFIQNEGFDAVICTHVFASLMVTDAREKYGLSVRSCVVETDYTVTPGAQAGKLDWHFIPSEELREELVSLGVPDSRVIASGIPVRQAFYEDVDRAGARQALGIPGDCRHILVMGGSMGAGPVPELVRALAHAMDSDVYISIVCGTNRSLLESLRAEYGSHPRMRLHGYVDFVALLMGSADLLVTKPGGISVTEAAVMGLPMVLANTVAGCEAYNLAFFEQHGGAATADSPAALARLCLDLLGDDALRERMSRALRRIADKNDREIIWRTMHG